MPASPDNPPPPPVVQVRQLRDPRKVYESLMELISRLAGLGLVHCDFNEFNLLASSQRPPVSCHAVFVTNSRVCSQQVDDKEDITLIDFPQMVSVNHANAEVRCGRQSHTVHTL